MYLCVCAHACLRISLRQGQKKTIRSPGHEIVVVCSLPNIGAKMQTQFLQKMSKDS